MGFRVKVNFQDCPLLAVPYDSVFIYISDSIRTIGELVDHIKKVLKIFHNLDIFIDGVYLPPGEAVDLVSDRDVLQIRMRQDSIVPNLIEEDAPLEIRAPIIQEEEENIKCSFPPKRKRKRKHSRQTRNNMAENEITMPEEMNVPAFEGSNTPAKRFHIHFAEKEGASNENSASQLLSVVNETADSDQIEDSLPIENNEINTNNETHNGNKEDHNETELHLENGISNFLPNPLPVPEENGADSAGNIQTAEEQPASTILGLSLKSQSSNSPRINKKKQFKIAIMSTLHPNMFD